jgi:hypothetical protein
VAALVLVLAHVLCALAGYGSIAMAGVYGGIGRHPDKPGAVGDLRRFFGPSSRMVLLVVPVPFLGAAALTVQHGASAIGRPWAGAAFGLWALSLVVTFGWIRPTWRRIGTLVLSLPQAGQDRSAGVTEQPRGSEVVLAELGSACRRMEVTAGICDVVFVVALMLMIFQPGGS